MAVVLILLQFGTGLLLKFAFDPTPVGAYESIRSLQSDVPFGLFVRNIHHWSANLLVLIVFLHMLRVFFSGAFQAPRQFNWIIGWTMAGAILLANFTGYLLPYDQLAYWAVTVSTGMLEYVPFIGEHLQDVVRGGDVIGPGTMRVFFAVHTALVPSALVFLMGFHFWRIRKAGGVVVPRRPGEGPVESPTRVPVLPNLLLREIVTALVLMAAMLLLSVFFNAPLGNPANPGLSPNPTKAPWYFSGLQELLLHLHPTFAVFLIPLLAIFAIIALPYIGYETDSGGIWFISQRGRLTAAISAVTAVIVVPSLIVIDHFLGGMNVFPTALPPLIIRGVIPALLLVIAIVGFYMFMKRRYSLSNNEAIQAVFVFLVAALVTLTVVGVWFRGSGMTLVLPWNS